MVKGKNRYNFEVLTKENWAREVSYFFLGNRTNTWMDFLKEGWREDSSQAVQDVLVYDDARTPIAAILQRVDAKTLKIAHVFFQTSFVGSADDQVDRLTEILETYLIHAKDVLWGKELPEFDEVEFMTSVNGLAFYAKCRLSCLDPRNDPSNSVVH